MARQDSRHALLVSVDYSQGRKFQKGLQPNSEELIYRQKFVEALDSLFMRR
jgi:hypothetical protein